MHGKFFVSSLYFVVHLQHWHQNTQATVSWLSTEGEHAVDINSCQEIFDEDMKLDKSIDPFMVGLN